MNIIIFTVLAVILAASCHYVNSLQDPKPRTSRPSLDRKFVIDPILRQSQPTTVETTVTEIRNAVNRRTLTRRDRKNILETVETTFKLLNPNLNTYSSLSRPPAKALRLLRSLQKSIKTFKVSPFHFHLDVVALFYQLNDLHTIYLPPAPLRSAFGFVGFFIDPYWKTSKERGFLFSAQGTIRSVNDTYFKEGVEILEIDGKSVLSEAKRLGKQWNAAGDTNDNKIRAGALSITARFIDEEIPKKEALHVLYVDLNGTRRSISIPWKFYTSRSELEGNATVDSDKSEFSIVAPAVSRFEREQNQFHYEGSPIINHKYIPLLKVYSHPSHMEYRRAKAAARSAKLAALSSAFMTESDGQSGASSKQAVDQISGIAIPVLERFENDLFAAVFTVQSVSGQTSSFGYIFVDSFSFAIETPDVRAFVSELVRILGLLPANKLLLDLRGNGGGFATNVDTIFRVLVGDRRRNYPFAMRANNLTSYLVGDPAVGVQYARSGEFLTSYFSDIIFFRELANLDIPRAFNGRLALLVDSGTASAGDTFAAVCKEYIDPGTGVRTIPIIGTDRVTSGAGASVIDVDPVLQAAAEDGRIKRSFSIAGLGVSISTAFLRVNRSFGLLVEHFGVNVDFWYKETKRDIIRGNRDLLLFANKILSEPLPRLNVI